MTWARLELAPGAVASLGPVPGNLVHERGDCAAWSLDGLHRYRLVRDLRAAPRGLFDPAPSERRLCTIMANPSKAGAVETDNTVTRVIGFARSWNFGLLDVVNADAFVATNPDDLRAAEARGVNVRGEHNLACLQAAIKTALASGGDIFCAWGNVGRDRAVDDVLALLREIGAPVRAWRLTSKGRPEHPLYAPGGATLTSWPDGGCA